MNSPVRYYPEFDSSEVEETIAPLGRFDDQIIGVLRRGEPAVARPVPGGEIASAVRAWCEERERYPFQRVIRSVAAAVAEADPIGAHAELFDDVRGAVIQMLDRAESRLREVWTRPLVAAVNHAREQGRLDGDDPAARYEHFVDASLRTSFEEVSGLVFPVLHEVSHTLLRHEIANAREFCGRLLGDRQAIAAVFGIEVTDPLVSFGLADGDSHHHGHTVSVLRFRSGKKLAYKPRDVSCEAAYEVIAHALNDRFGTSLASAAVLERDGYGYVEYVGTEDVSDLSAEFMAASGELAAVLYLLNARDMHFENIVATRRGPVPIDLETFLHPARIHVGPTPEADGNAYDTIGQSIYGIGILPLVMMGKGDDSGHVDLGFLGAQGRGSSPFKSMRFEDPYTDRVRLALAAQGAQERWTVVDELTEEQTRVLGARMADGFARVFRAVAADRAFFDALVRKVAIGVRVRYVHNPTAQYAQTLRLASGAAAMDGFEPYLALLKRIAIASKTSSRAIVLSELRQLAERDVPYFTVAATGVALEDGDGIEVGACFEQSPVERALAKTAALSEFELTEQLKLIYSAFSSRFPDNHLAAGPAASPPPAPERPGGELTDLVTRLADTLVATSLPDRFAHLPRTWIGPLASAQTNRPWPAGVLGYDLYTGRVGIALALAAAGRALGEDRYRDLAAQIFSTTAEILSGQRYEARSVEQAGFGGYRGLSGTLFALSAAGRLLGHESWVTAAQEAVPLVLAQVRSQPTNALPLDTIGGLAGVLGCVMAIGGPHAEEATAVLTASLVDGLRHGEGRADVVAQSGFAHGLSGVVHALSRAHPWVPAGQRDVVEATLAALVARLGSFYDQEAGNWFSNAAAPRKFSTGWCHGSTGIALALSSYRRVSENDVVTALRDRAVDNILRLGFGRNLTWCHGDLGNHDTLVGIARGGDDSVREKLAKIESDWLRPDVFARKIEDTTSRYAHTSSVMVGTAGVLLHLVNRLDPAARVSPIALTVEGRSA
ncbi:type 2 lanthipeptide synthetase LanM [Amycolatopsis minnesotensis]|uniref:Type 2 lanthipeptide synthetase LanM family protein n=1 Tax=Amycolatopsis minnesotensis TaxID=337894 RepID=A0ABP5C2P4_9PSEU